MDLLKKKVGLSPAIYLAQEMILGPFWVLEHSFCLSKLWQDFYSSHLPGKDEKKSSGLEHALVFSMTKALKSGGRCSSGRRFFLMSADPGH